MMFDVQNRIAFEKKRLQEYVQGELSVNTNWEKSPLSSFFLYVLFSCNSYTDNIGNV